MKSSTDLLTALGSTLRGMDEDALAIGDFAHVLQAVTQNKSISDEHVPRVYRIVVEIIGRVGSLKELVDDAQQKARLLSNS